MFHIYSKEYSGRRMIARGWFFEAGVPYFKIV
jgi:hypothetical protein